MRFHFLSSSSSTVAFLLLAASPSGLLFQAGLADAAGVKQQDIAGVDDLIPLPNADASSILAAPLLLRGASGGNPPALLLEQQQEGYKNGGTGGGFLRGLGAGEKEEALLHQRVRDLQALFQTCPADPGQNGVFPDEGFFSDSRCLTYGTAGLIGIEKLIEVLAGEDSTMSKTADSVLAPLMMVSEKGADMAGIDFRICAADFPGAKVKKPTMDMNMVDICKGLPLQKTDDAEWAIFAFQLGIPEAIASVACQIPKDISIQACVGVSLCGDFPSVAFAFNAGLASCIIGQVGYATAGIGSAIAAGIEMGIDKIGAGFSLTNAFEVPLTVFNGFDLLPYTARPTLYLQARFAIESKKIDALMDGWFVIGIEGIFGLSVWIEDDELADDQLVEGRVNSWNMNATCNNSTDTPDSGLFDLFDDLTLEMFLTVKADFTLDLKKVFAKPKPGTEGATTAADGGTNSAADCGLGCEGTTGAEMSEAGASLSKKKEGFSIANYLPKISIPQAAEMSAHVTTGERVVEEHIIYPGVSFYVGLSAAASFVKSLAADILKALDGITKFLGIEFDAQEVLDGLGGKTVTPEDQFGIGMSFTEYGVGVILNAPLLIAKLAYFQLTCQIDFDGIECQFKIFDGIEELFKIIKGAVEDIKDGLAITFSEISATTGEVLKDVGVGVKMFGDELEGILTGENLKASADAILTGMIESDNPFLVSLAKAMEPLVSDFRCIGNKEFPTGVTGYSNRQERCELATQQLDDGYIYLYNGRKGKDGICEDGCPCCQSKMRYAAIGEPCGPGVHCENGKCPFPAFVCEAKSTLNGSCVLNTDCEGELKCIKPDMKCSDGKEGSPCTLTADCNGAPDLICEHDGFLTGSCIPKKTLDEKCGAHDDCASNKCFGEPFNLKCSDGKIGSSCWFDVECNGEFYCAHSAEGDKKFTCHEGALADACDKHNHCSSVICFQDICQSGASGSPCGNQNHCDTNNYCKAGATLLDAGMCTILPGNGESCTWDPYVDTCSSGSKCLARGVCTNGNYGSQCTVGGDCDGSMYCNGGYCRDGRSGNGCVVHGDCQSTNYCKSEKCTAKPTNGQSCAWGTTNVCSNSVCLLRGVCTNGDRGSPCTDQNNCDSGLYCASDKTCKTKPTNGQSCIWDLTVQTCSSSVCLARGVCTNGNYGSPCTVGGDCDGSMYCNGGYCRDGRSGNGCVVHGDCQSTNYCKSEKCTAKPTNGQSCAWGTTNVCSNSVCLLRGVCTNGDRGSPCTDQNNCDSGLYCASDKTCKTKPTNGQSCIWDLTVQTCSSSVCLARGVCTNGNYGSPCTVGGDCDGSMYCNGGYCRDGRYGNGCVANWDCQGSMYCNGGYCRDGRKGNGCVAHWDCKSGWCWDWKCS